MLKGLVLRNGLARRLRWATGPYGNWSGQQSHLPAKVAIGAIWQLRPPAAASGSYGEQQRQLSSIGSYCAICLQKLPTTTSESYGDQQRHLAAKEKVSGVISTLESRSFTALHYLWRRLYAQAVGISASIMRGTGIIFSPAIPYIKSCGICDSTFCPNQMRSKVALLI